jgi:hypothetical protein
MTLANAPLSARDARLNAADLPDGTSEIFFADGLDRGVAKQPDGQISLATVRARKPHLAATAIATRRLTPH